MAAASTSPGIRENRHTLAQQAAAFNAAYGWLTVFGPIVHARTVRAMAAPLCRSPYKRPRIACNFPRRRPGRSAGASFALTFRVP